MPYISPQKFKDTFSPVDVSQLYEIDTDAGTITRNGRPVGHVANVNGDYASIAVGLSIGAIFTKMPRSHVIWAAHRGQWNSLNTEIDHINRCGTDDRIVNLREATRSLNNTNRAMRSKNAGGAQGVTFVPSRKKKKYYARFKQRSLGYYHTLDEAVAAYNAARRNILGHDVL